MNDSLKFDLKICFVSLKLSKLKKLFVNYLSFCLEVHISINYYCLLSSFSDSNGNVLFKIVFKFLMEIVQNQS